MKGEGSVKGRECEGGGSVKGEGSVKGRGA